MTVSVCIPTYNRPTLLEEAVCSALAQTRAPAEILIGDDSVDALSEPVAARLQAEARIPIRYIHNRPPLGQAANVDSLFRTAAGNWLVLLHDDDLLLPEAIEILTAAIESADDLVAAYGKQLLLREDGSVDEAQSHRLNRAYYRTPERVGIQPSALKAAVLQQFPNDGFIVDAQAARAVGYTQPGIKDGCDFAFGLELARIGRCFHFVDRFVVKLRPQPASVSQSATFSAPHEALQLVEQTSGIDWNDSEIRVWAKQLAPIAIASAARCGHRQAALRWYLGPLHRGKLLTPGGLHRLYMIFSHRSR